MGFTTFDVFVGKLLYNVTGITTFDVYATKLLGKITSLYVDGIFSSIVLLTYRRR